MLGSLGGNKHVPVGKFDAKFEEEISACAGSNVRAANLKLTGDTGPGNLQGLSTREDEKGHVAKVERETNFEKRGKGMLIMMISLWKIVMILS